MVFHFYENSQFLLGCVQSKISSKSFLTCCFSLFHRRTLQHYRMGDPRHTFAFIKTGLTE